MTHAEEKAFFDKLADLHSIKRNPKGERQIQQLRENIKRLSKPLLVRFLIYCRTYDEKGIIEVIEKMYELPASGSQLDESA